MSGQFYQRPPITEAVIELRFATPVAADQLEKIQRRFSVNYPRYQQIRNVGFELNLTESLEVTPQAVTNQHIGHRLTSDDATEILLLEPFSIAVSQLAPYPGWEMFFPRFVRDWEVWKGLAGYLKILRVGVRFINRVDIPIVDGLIQEAEYLTVYPKLPDILGPVLGYGVQAQLSLADIDCDLTINSAAVPSPLIGHGSIVLDLDIKVETGPPQNDAEIYEALNKIRIKKNEVFNACLTPKAKELFQ